MIRGSLRAFLKAPGGLLSLFAIALLALVAILAPMLVHDKATALDVLHANQKPGLDHLLGTDALGRDIFSRILVATRLSLTLALAAAAIGALIGIPLGAGAAIMPRWLRSILLRAVDAMIIFPGILIAIIVGMLVSNRKVGAVLGVGIASSFAFARVASSLTMSVSGRDYVAAARVAGIRGPRVLLRYVLPNVTDTLAITTTVVISGSIVQVSALSFLGLGVQAPEFDWGALLTEGLRSFYAAPAAAMGTVTAVAISSIAFGFAGEALARASNPLLWARRSAVVDESGDVDNTPLPVEGLAPVSVPDRARDIGDNVLDVADLTVEFPGATGRVRVVDGVTFALGKGEMLGIVGESGSGKTMAAMAIAGLVPYPGTVTGTVKLQGNNLKAMPLDEVDRVLGSSLAVVFQDPLSSLNPALRIGVQLTEGVETHTSISHSAAVDRAVDRLREVALPVPKRQLRRYPHELSGGMRQRVMIAMGLMNEPALLIADEPTTALDVTAQAQIMDLLERINDQHGTSVILISHNLGLVSQNCDRVFVMYAGRVVEELTTDQLVSAPLHPYTAALVAALPDASSAVGVPLASIPGHVPDFSALPTGCAYHPRCPLALERCRVERPTLLLRPDSRRVACWVANEDLA